MIAYPLSYLQRSGHVVEWLYEGLQILVFKQFYLSSHSKVPVKESIILKFVIIKLLNHYFSLVLCLVVYFYFTYYCLVAPSLIFIMNLSIHFNHS